MQLIKFTIPLLLIFSANSFAFSSNNNQELFLYDIVNEENVMPFKYSSLSVRNLNDKNIENEIVSIISGFALEYFLPEDWFVQVSYKELDEDSKISINFEIKH